MKLVVLDLEGTLAYAWDYANPIIKDGQERYPMIVENGVAECIKKLQDMGCKVALATGVDAGKPKKEQDTLQYYEYALKANGIHINILEPDNSQGKDSKLDKLNKYAQQFGIGKNDIFYFDDGSKVIKECQEAGYSNAQQVFYDEKPAPHHRTLKQRLDETILILENDLKKKEGLDKSAKPDQTKKNAAQMTTQPPSKNDTNKQLADIKNKKTPAKPPEDPKKASYASTKLSHGAPGAHIPTGYGAPGAPPIPVSHGAPGAPMSSSSSSFSSSDSSSSSANSSGHVARSKSPTRKESHEPQPAHSKAVQQSAQLVPSKAHSDSTKARQDPTKKDLKQQQQGAQQAKKLASHNFVRDLEDFRAINRLIRSIVDQISRESIYKYNTGIEYKINKFNKVMEEEQRVLSLEEQLDFYRGLKLAVEFISKLSNRQDLKKSKITTNFGGEPLEQTLEEWNNVIIKGAVEKVDRRIKSLEAEINQSAPPGGPAMSGHVARSQSPARKESQQQPSSSSSSASASSSKSDASKEPSSKGQEMLYQKSGMHDSKAKSSEENRIEKAADELYNCLKNKLDTIQAASFMANFVNLACLGDGKGISAAVVQDDRKYLIAINEKKLGIHLETLVNELKKEKYKKLGSDLGAKYDQIVAEEVLKPSP